MKNFLRWLIMFSLINLGLFVLFYTGLMVKIYAADVTKITFLILTVFLIMSVKIGIKCYRKNAEPTFADRIESIRSDFVSLGLIGTVCGFVYMAHSVFSGINISDLGGVQTSLLDMASGMLTALYTTAAGLICKLLLKYQLIIYQNATKQHQPF